MKKMRRPITEQKIVKGKLNKSVRKKKEVIIEYKIQNKLTIYENNTND